MNAMKVLTLNVICILVVGGMQTLTADQVKLDVSPVRSVLKAGEKQMTGFRVGLD